jgi:hypothetical protein
VADGYLGFVRKQKEPQNVEKIKEILGKRSKDI